MRFDAQLDKITTLTVALNNLNVAVQINLPTTGGTPAPLNYYEEYNAPITMGGPVANTTSQVWIYRIGKICVLILNGVTGAANGSGGFFASTSSIPSRFFPITGASVNCNVLSGVTDSIGICTLDTLGSIKIFSDATFAGFSTTGTNAINVNPTIIYITS